LKQKTASKFNHLHLAQRGVMEKTWLTITEIKEDGKNSGSLGFTIYPTLTKCCGPRQVFQSLIATVLSEH